MTDLDRIADILEKTATYVDAVEGENQRLKQAQTALQTEQTRAEAEKLAEAINRATGETPDLDVVMKLAQTDDEDIKNLFKKLASTEEVDSLGIGDDRGRTKVASDVPAEDRQFLDFLLGN